MTFLKAVAMFCAVIGATFPPSATAGEWDRSTVITLSAPVEIPGAHLAGWGVLPAGTYVFKILDSASDRHIVQIFSQDEKTMYATVLAIPNYRLKATDKTVITFSERPVGQPEALRAWFYPGHNWGEEFVYPKAKALELAKSTNSVVLYTPAEIAPEVTTPIKSAAEPLVLELKQAPLMAVKPSGEEVQITEAVTAPPPEVLVAENRAPVAEQRLPKTASPLPMIGLIGLLALTGGLALRFAGQRVQ